MPNRRFTAPFCSAEMELHGSSAKTHGWKQGAGPFRALRQQLGDSGRLDGVKMTMMAPGPGMMRQTGAKKGLLKEVLKEL